MTVFVISKSLQLYDSEDKPCKNARMGSAMYVGTGITTPHKVWLVDISSLEELLKLEKEVGKIIVRVKESAFTIPEIEIYNTYRE